MKAEQDKDFQINYVGIDISQNVFEICVINGDGKVSKTFSISSDNQGFNSLLHNITPGTKPIFAMESTGSHSGNIFHYLTKKGYKCLDFNPYDVSRLREAFSKRMKNDAIDAFVLAQAARMNVLKHSSKEVEYIQLQDLLERYHDLVDRKTTMINQLRANLVETFPEITKIFKYIDSISMMTILLNYGSTSAFADANLIQVKSSINQLGGKVTMMKLEKLQELCNETVAWKQDRFYRLIIQSQIRELSAIKKEIDLTDEILDEFVERNFSEKIQLLRSIPGFGKVTALRTLAILGDHDRFDVESDGKGAKRVSSFLGFGVREYSSGPRSIKGKISKRGDPRLRGLLYMAALSAIRKDEAIASYFQKKKDRSGGKNATVAVSHLLIRRAYGVLKTGKKYNPKIPAAG